MVAAAQVSFLNMPAVSEADVTRLAWRLSRMYYGDSLLCGRYALDREMLDSSYVEWLLYRHDRQYLKPPFECERLIGVVEVRADTSGTLAAVRLKLARVLLQRYEWDMRRVRFVPYGAVTPEELDVERIHRLIEKKG